jgi:NAD(P)H-dependent FMN reductase
MDLSVPVILGTARDGRNSEAVAEFVADYLPTTGGIDSELIDVRDYQLGQTYEAWNEHEEVPEIADWKEVAEEADGFVIVTPEYNHGYPGELKILLDSAFEEYFDKPVSLVGVSAGGFGGARVVEHIKPVLIELGMKVMGNAVYASHAGDMFEGGLDPQDREKLEGQVDSMAEEFIGYGQALKQMREEE